jgi:DNA (cytosine-5)-methyltransferase 1
VIDVELFSGAGGGSLGLQSVGLDPVGFDSDEDSVRTHRRAGFLTVRSDLSSAPWSHLRGRVRLMHGSPPCQPFSSAGDGGGEDDARDGMPWMLEAIDVVRPEVVTVENVPGLLHEKHGVYLAGFLSRFAALGYRVEFRVLCAADFGVPQTRRRLIIVGRREGWPVWPMPTHTEEDGLFTARWVSMAEALGWPGDAQRRGSALQPGSWADGRGGNRRTYGVDEPAPPPVVLGNDSAGWMWRLNTGRDWKPGGDRTTAQRIDLDCPAPTVSSVPGQWMWDRPATTVAGDTRVHPPGHKINAEDIAAGRSGHDRRGSTAIRVTLEELAVLQGFPPGYPFCGNRTSIARQIGNALPPQMLAAVVAANLTERTV